jgi:dihydroflavonol-4-reductase
MKRYGLGYYNTKHEAEELVLKAAKAGLINAVSVNPAIMFGPGDGLKDSRKIHLKVARGKMPFYPSGGVNVMDVRDAVDGHFVALEKGVSGERYILSGENIYVKDLFQWLAEAGGVKPPNVLLPKIMLRTLRGLKPILNMAGVGHKLPIDSAFLSTFFHWYDNTKAKKDLGLKTRSARQAVIESIAWCKSQGLL